jgi:hypothetical protein
MSLFGEFARRNGEHIRMMTARRLTYGMCVDPGSCTLSSIPVCKVGSLANYACAKALLINHGRLHGKDIGDVTVYRKNAVITVSWCRQGIHDNGKTHVIQRRHRTHMSPEHREIMSRMICRYLPGQGPYLCAPLSYSPSSKSVVCGPAWYFLIEKMVTR